MKWLLLIASIGVLPACASIHVVNDPKIKEIANKEIAETINKTNVEIEIPRERRHSHEH